MQKISQLVVSVLLLAGSNACNATTFTYTDVVEPAPDALISFGNHKSYSFSHDILDDGFNPLTDTIISSSLLLNFSDESADAAPESVSFTFDFSPFGTQLITSGGVTYPADFSGPTLSGLISPDGILDVRLENAGTTNSHQQNRSDFLFLGSTLTVTFDRADNDQDPAPSALAIPEPATVALLGIGLIGLGWTSRAGKRKYG